MKVSIKTSILTISLAALFASAAFAQCPIVSVSAPDGEVIAGDLMIFSAGVASGEMKSAMMLSYNWSISSGKITSGQGTSVIKVDTADLAGQTVTATLELGGLPPECPRSSSATGYVKQEIVASKIDEFGAITEEDLWARLDSFTLLIQNDPNAEGYLISYRSPKDPVGHARAANKAMLKYLVEMRRVDVNRIKSIDGGVRATAMRELWIVPQGAKPPKPTPMAATPKAPTPKKPGIKKKP